MRWGPDTLGWTDIMAEDGTKGERREDKRRKRREMRIVGPPDWRCAGPTGIGCP